MATEVISIVKDMEDKLRNNPSTRFSQSDFEELIYALIKDNSHKIKNHQIKKLEIVSEDGTSVSDDARAFFKKLLKHSGINNEEEMDVLIDTFEYRPKDLAWISKCFNEAIRIYTDCGKSAKMMTNSMISLSIKKVVRTGKYDGEETYKRSVGSLKRSLERMKKAREKAAKAIEDNK